MPVSLSGEAYPTTGTIHQLRPFWNQAFLFFLLGHGLAHRENILIYPNHLAMEDGVFVALLI